MRCSSVYTRLGSVLLLMVPAVLADECQPVTWKRDVGSVVCRYWVTSSPMVNYYSCTEMADHYVTLLDDFFLFNPELKRDCSNIQPNTQYCVKGFIQQPVAEDGLCGIPNNNATCAGTDKQCCNSITWKCGDTAEDCEPGTCYSGTCHGADEYAIDGKCGEQHGGLLCGGRWGDCCNNDGVCGTGADFCGAGKCQSGNCTETASTTTTGRPPPSFPTSIPMPTTTSTLSGDATQGTATPSP